MTTTDTEFQGVREDSVLRAAFLAGRSIGGSQVGQLLGLSAWGDAGDVFDAVYGLQAETPPTAPMRRGTLLEPLIADELEAAYGPLQRVPARHPHPTLPMLHGSIDRMAMRDGQPGIIEIKCLGYASRTRFATEGVDPSYVVQVQTYFAIAPHAQWADLVVFDAGEWEFVSYPIARDPALIAQIEAEVVRFWRECIEPCARPMFWPSPIHLLPITTEKTVPVVCEGPDWVAALRALQHCRDAAKGADERKEAAEALVKRLMGERTAIAVPGVGRVSWAEQVRTSLDTTAMFRDHPSLSESQYTRRTISRVFRPTFPKG